MLLNRPSQGFDYAEAVNSASSVATPPNEPFASDDLGETVVRLDKAMARMRLQHQMEGKAESIASPYKTDTSEATTQSDVLVGIVNNCVR